MKDLRKQMMRIWRKWNKKKNKKKSKSRKKKGEQEIDKFVEKHPVQEKQKKNSR
jgi:hypothetical protein